jgi:ABC-type multidrug transport system ATPase subunit
VGHAADSIGPFELRDQLGRGASAVVWRGYDPSLDREVAIKEPQLPEGSSDEVRAEFGERFVREARAAARLNHPGIVAIHSAAVYDQRPVIVMELVEGRTLRDVLAGGPLPTRQAYAVLDQLLSAVGYAHEQGVIHRDLKPENVFITQDGDVKVTDFGIAHFEPADAAGSLVGTGGAALTRVGTLPGTPAYRAPEQIRGETGDARSDVFALGVLAYECLSGANPFGDERSTHYATIMHRIMSEPAPRIETTDELADPLTGVILRALEKDRDERFDDAAAMLAAWRTAFAAPVDVKAELAAHCGEPATPAATDVQASPGAEATPGAEAARAASAPAGWYPDSEHAGQHRYWDGAQWTDHRTWRSGEVLPAAATAGTAAGRPVLTSVGACAILPNGQRILDDIDLVLREKTMVAVVGPSGSGKSTLLKTLTGFRPPEEGLVLISGEDLYSPASDARRHIGYVPQDDILHPQLTIRRALKYGAQLRFPSSTKRGVRKRRVKEVMAELGLTERARVRIEKLSGGQRKRVSVAMELLTKPSLLFLDEPTSGLDPGLEQSVMELLQGLARGGRVVVVVTHSVQSLDLCDQVLFLAPGGREAFFGPTAEALQFFGRSQYASVFQELEATPAKKWKRGGVKPLGGRRPTPQPLERAAEAGAGWGRQLWTLCRRQLSILVADRRNLLYLLAEVLIPAVLILAIVGGHSFRPDPEQPHAVRTLVGALAVSATVIGAANAIREVVKELPIYYRERAVGLSRSAYLASKTIVLGALTTLQIVILVLIATRGAAGPNVAILPWSPLLELTADLALGGIAAMTLGLLISTMVSSSEKAMALVPVVFIVMWLFSGQAVDLQQRPEMRTLGYLVSANWSMSLAASSCDLCGIENKVFAASVQTAGTAGTAAVPAEATGATAGPPNHDPRWQHGLRPWLLSVMALLVLSALGLKAAGRMLARKEPFLRR